ncbi:hypothetical protein OH76DRAFT_1230066 [Lentinus brumalis]|uniref:Uncharacterized protein n=1 Tax=Lentinus brumalis TaxID=2498619 RepID=A0A371DLY8_9APHY|nr:hypothetical protein OH76DRAFT_1230066 [Polyporus brumalis]
MIALDTKSDVATFSRLLSKRKADLPTITVAPPRIPYPLFSSSTDTHRATPRGTAVCHLRVSFTTALTYGKRSRSSASGMRFRPTTRSNSAFGVRALLHVGVEAHGDEKPLQSSMLLETASFSKRRNATRPDAPNLWQLEGSFAVSAAEQRAQTATSSRIILNNSRGYGVSISQRIMHWKCNYVYI